MTKKELKNTGAKKPKESKGRRELISLISDLADVAREKGINLVEVEGIKILMGSKPVIAQNVEQNKEDAKIGDVNKAIEEFKKLQDKVSMADAGVI